MPPEKRNNRIAVYFTKSELSLLESEKNRLNEDSASKVIVKICKDYFNNLQSDHEEKIESMTDDERKMLQKHEEDLKEIKKDLAVITKILQNLEIKK
ncbi:hypothetical protein F1737_08905 [Methanoplanus sp. FWC-SCC4]|uniref:Uncharacterized protein n=1 Tax=Methanochimaera problematica TaxID=2609417 RepID=A0AA97I3J8_9EURY|nr:hypothetical protein [Methanoplanus sp. FWC-SCC4]WOF16798.1 hypothetical protein F1737_08905 [Methanoplanus sp. FWC-SCC4]